MAGISVVSMAGEATADTPAETPNSPKVSASRKIDVQMKKEMNKAQQKEENEGMRYETYQN